MSPTVKAVVLAAIVALAVSAAVARVPAVRKIVQGV
jgi:hypothetical protein